MLDPALLQQRSRATTVTPRCDALLLSQARSSAGDGPGVHRDSIWETADIRASTRSGPLGRMMTMPTPDADHASRAETAPPVVVPATASGLDVTVRFDRASVWRSGLVLAGLGVGLLLFLWLFSMLSHFLFLLVLAWLFATALEPGIRWLVQRGRSRGVSTAIVGGSAVVLALGLAVVFGQLFFNQVTDFVNGVPDLTTSVIDWVNHRFRTNLDPTTIASQLHLDPSQIATWAGSLSGGVLGVVGSLSSVLFDLVTVLVFGFYFAGAGPKLVHSLASWMPPRVQEVFITITEITIAKTGGYVVSKIVLAAASAFFHGIFFAAIGVPYWLPFALFAGITSQFVPIVGTYLGVILPPWQPCSTARGRRSRSSASPRCTSRSRRTSSPRASASGRWTSTPPSPWARCSSALPSGARSAR